MEKTRLLLVDDDEGIRHSLTLILTKKGYYVENAGSGSEALKELGHKTFDILITDLKMPEMSGIELLKAANKIAPDLGAIIMTGYGEINSYLEAMDLGAAEYLNKPVKSEELEAIIKKLMARKNS